MLPPSSRQGHTVVDSGLPERKSRRTVRVSNATARYGTHVRCGNRAVDAVPHVRGAPRRGRPQPMLLHLTPAGRSTLDERVVGCFRKCLVAAMTLVYLVNCAIQQHAGERTPRGLTAQRLKPVDRWFAQEFTVFG